MQEQQAPCAAAAEFEIEKYKLDRAHELELNKFTHTLEMERLKLLTLLNGGAATAWLTFSNAAKAPDDLGIRIYAIVVPTALWLIGLLSASQATNAALDTQREYTKAYHRRRRADEWRAFGRSLEPDEIKRMIPPPKCKNESETSAEAYGRLADAAAECGGHATRRVMVWMNRSLAAFVAGAAAAGVLILRGNGGG